MTEQRDLYVEKLKERIDKWDSEIGMLETKANQLEAIRVEYKRKLEELRAKYKELENRVDELQQPEEGALEDLKQGLENTWEILKARFSKAKSEFERGYKEGPGE